MGLLDLVGLIEFAHSGIEIEHIIRSESSSQLRRQTVDSGRVRTRLDAWRHAFGVASVTA